MSKAIFVMLFLILGATIFIPVLAETNTLTSTNLTGPITSPAVPENTTVTITITTITTTCTTTINIITNTTTFNVTNITTPLSQNITTYIIIIVTVYQTVTASLTTNTTITNTLFTNRTFTSTVFEKKSILQNYSFVLLTIAIVVIMMVAIIFGALVDIFDKIRKTSAFVSSLLFCLLLGVGYGFIIGYMISKGVV